MSAIRLSARSSARADDVAATPTWHRRIFGWLLALTIISIAGVGSGCGGSSSTAAIGLIRPNSHGTPVSRRSAPSARNRKATTLAATPAHSPMAPVVTPTNRAGNGWRPVAKLGAQVAAWEAERSGVTLLRFDQSVAQLTLHAGLGEPTGAWRYGDRIGPSEIHRVIAAFNGGFKFETGVVGYMSEGRVAEPLRFGRASIVTYRNGITEIGAWGAGIPIHSQQVASVLQNLRLLVDHGRAAGNVGGCIQSCWGATVGGVNSTARSALGIDGDGRLIWAAGESLLPSELARALLAAGARRAVELDINPDWVAGYLYTHSGGGPSPAPVVPGQLGIAGRFLQPYTRDFFTIIAR